MCEHAWQKLRRKGSISGALEVLPVRPRVGPRDRFDEPVAQHHHWDAACSQPPLDRPHIGASNIGRHPTPVIVATRLQNDVARLARNHRRQPRQHLPRRISIDARVPHASRNASFTQHPFEMRRIGSIAADALAPRVARTERDNLHTLRVSGLQDGGRCE